MNIEDYMLSYLPNCNGQYRMQKWKESGGTLKQNTNLGCGINSLTFLGVFTRKDGEYYVENIGNNGTSFIDMMKHVSIFNKNQITYQEIIFYFDTDDSIPLFLDKITLMLPENSCTVAKLNRDKDRTKRPSLCKTFTEGHSIVFSKEKGILYTIDPQQMKILERNDSKIIKSWSSNCYISVSLIFQPKYYNTPIQPIKKANFSELNYTPPILVNLDENGYSRRHEQTRSFRRKRSRSLKSLSKKTQSRSSSKKSLTITGTPMSISPVSSKNSSMSTGTPMSIPSVSSKKSSMSTGTPMSI